MAREQRRLAAIIAADVVGYSRLMGRDESGTLARLREHRKQRFEPTLARHGGRLVKLTGDGALAEFPSAVDALGAAIEFQEAMADANKNEAPDTAIVFRIGLHLGDLIVDGDDLYGDGVNVAARLEAEAPAGGIVLSGNVRDAVAGRLKATFDDLGSLALKNIERPVQAFGVKWDPADWKASAPASVVSAIAAPATPDAPLALPDKPSIAVLPFQNMSGDPEQEYFADGMVEDIITALSRFKSLFVIARNSSFTYKGKAVDIKRVGRELGVRYVLEGSVRKAGGRLRITGQLIECESGSHLWAERFDGSLEDIFELQDQVARSVVGAIAPTIGNAEMERARRKPVESLAAYDYYLRGLALSYVMTREANEECLRLLHHAMEFDPAFAAPYSAAATCYLFRRTQGWVADADRETAEARRLAHRAAALGPDDAATLCGAGFALFYVCHEEDVGAALVDKGLTLNPNEPNGLRNRAVICLFLGEHDVAIDLVARVVRLSPMDPAIGRAEAIRAQALFLLGRYDEAIRAAATSLAHEPNYMQALRTSAAANALAGNSVEARKAMDQLRRVYPAATISGIIGLFPYRRPQDVERIAEGLRLAGMPE